MQNFLSCSIFVSYGQLLLSEEQNRSFFMSFSETEVMTTTCFQTVINQNQQTIDFLKARDYYSAVVSSSSALQCLGISILSIQQQDKDILQAISSWFSPCQSAFDRCMLLTNIQEDDTHTYEEPRHPFIYSHGISLPPTATDYAIITPILIFNSALAHQLVAMQVREEKRKSQYFQIALYLYTVVYLSKNIERNPLFHFVVCNNALASINLQIGNKDWWISNVEYLMSIYMKLVEQGCTSRLRHLQGFIESIIVAKPSAAAA